MATDNIKDRLLDDLEALRTELSGEPSSPDEAIPTLSSAPIPTLSEAKPSTKETLKNLDSELNDIIPAQPPLLVEAKEKKEDHNPKAEAQIGDKEAPANNRPKQTDLISETEKNDKRAVDSQTQKTHVQSKHKTIPELVSIEKELPASNEDIQVHDKPLPKTSLANASPQDEPLQSKAAHKNDIAKKEKSTETTTEAKTTTILKTEATPIQENQDNTTMSKQAPQAITQPSEVKVEKLLKAKYSPQSGYLPVDKKTVISSAPLPDQKTPNNGAVDDNPFLPKHLRERLSQSKNELMEEISRSTDVLNANSAFLKNYNTADTTEKGVANTKDPSLSSHRHLIDSLIGQYLPIIEADLRKRLEESLRSK